jgi:hypothetical protein
MVEIIHDYIYLLQNLLRRELEQTVSDLSAFVLPTMPRKLIVAFNMRQLIVAFKF